MPTFEDSDGLTSTRSEDHQLWEAIRSALPELERLLAEVDGHWGGEDLVYRFYHQSWKVYHAQSVTLRMVEALRALAPAGATCTTFNEIVDGGTGRQFASEVNRRWAAETRPIIEALFHARYFLAQACKYGRELDKPPTLLPSGWAALLELYDIR